MVLHESVTIGVVAEVNGNKYILNLNRNNSLVFGIIDIRM